MSVQGSPSDSCSSRSSDPSLPRRANPTHCAICNKRARTLHYGILACGACKAFFRRSLMNERELHCKRMAECSKPPEYWTDPKNAQRVGQCSWCRLERFVALGMNPSAVIPSDGRDLLEYPNVAKLFETCRNLLAHSLYHTKDAYSPFSENLNRTFWRIRQCDTKHRQLRTSEFNPTKHCRFNWDLTDYLNNPLEMNREIQEMVWAKRVKTPPLCIKGEVISGSDDNVGVVKRSKRRRRTLSLFNLQKDWPFVDMICAIEYVKFFQSTFELCLDSADQVAVLRCSVIQLRLLEMSYFSWSAGFDHLTFPDGTLPLSDISRSRPYSLLSKIAALPMTRSELSILKALLVCKAGGLSARGRAALDEIAVQSSKILMSACLRKYGDSGGIARVTAIADIFHVLEVVKSKEKQQHVIEHLDKKEPNMRNRELEKSISVVQLRSLFEEQA